MPNPTKASGLSVREMESGWSAHLPNDDTAHFLNATSAFILELCDGQHSLEEIADAVTEAFKLDASPTQDIEDLLTQATSAGLIQS